MNYRLMRVIVFFDLPVVTAAEKREYVQFRKFLLRDGFFMVQESVYCRLSQNQAAANALISHVKKNKPSAGVVQVLIVTEKQYLNMEMIVGEKHTDVINSAERLIEL